MLSPNFASFPETVTARLLLRKVRMEDATEILKLRSDEKVMQFIENDRAAGIADAEIFILRIFQSLQDNEGITWAIALKAEPDILIGTIGYWRLIKEHYRAEIGYMLNPVQWNKGIMKEALRKVVEYGFNELNLHSIEAHINPDNEASATILTSTGFVKEAHFKEDFFYKGVFRDTVVYSRLRHYQGSNPPI